MPSVGSQHFTYFKALGYGYNGRVCKADIIVLVLLQDFSATGKVAFLQMLDREFSFYECVYKREFSNLPQIGVQEITYLRDHRRGDQKPAFIPGDKIRGAFVP